MPARNSAMFPNVLPEAAGSRGSRMQSGGLLQPGRGKTVQAEIFLSGIMLVQLA